MISLIPAPLYAALANPIGNSGTPMDTVTEFFAAVLSVIVRVGSMVLVIMIIYAGYLFISAQGNMDQLKSAKHTLKWAVLGGALLLGAWALSLGIGDTINALQP